MIRFALASLLVLLGGCAVEPASPWAEFKRRDLLGEDRPRLVLLGGRDGGVLAVPAARRAVEVAPGVVELRR